MSGNPDNAALYGHRFQLLVKNTTTGSEVTADRVQSVDPNFTARTTVYKELGRSGPMGATQDPPDYRIVAEQNLTDSLELEYVLAGKNPAPAGAQSFQISDLINYSDKLTAYLLSRNQDGTLIDELEIANCAAAEIAYRFTIGEAMMQTFSLVGRSGKLYQLGSTIHTTWGTLDDTSLGGIHGKDARIWFTSGSVTTDRAYRLQSFTIRAAYPNVFVKELGNRSNAGVLSDVPEVTVEFDLLKADSQPTDRFYTSTGGYYDFANPLAPFNAFVRVFDPRDTEGLTVIKSFKLENVLPNAHTPSRTSVRGLATSRYGLTVSKETTTNSGGLIISNRNQ